MARDQHISLFFDVVEFIGLHQRTNSGTCKPAAMLLLKTQDEPWHRELGMNLAHPWRERAKPLGGRVAAAHVDCCVYLCLHVVAVSGLLATNNNILCRKLIPDQPKWTILGQSKQKIHHQTTQI